VGTSKDHDQSCNNSKLLYVMLGRIGQKLEVPFADLHNWECQCGGKSNEAMNGNVVNAVNEGANEVNEVANELNEVNEVANELNELNEGVNEGVNEVNGGVDEREIETVIERAIRKFKSLDLQHFRDQSGKPWKFR
jgi:hypothetical protein